MTENDKHIQMSYLDKLKVSASKYESIACFGLDPDISKLGLDSIKQFPEFLSRILNEMQIKGVFPGAFKPNKGFYERYDADSLDMAGSKTLRIVISLLKESFPDIPVILDYKTGDIGNTSRFYAHSGFESFGPDAVTVHPYMGTDSVEPYLEHSSEGKGSYILTLTSNKGAADFEKKEMLNGNYLYEEVAEMVIELSKKYPGTGAVVGATQEELGYLANLFFAPHKIPLLIPGVGAQGGSAKDVNETLVSAGYDLGLARINSSRGLLTPWKDSPVPADYQTHCVEALAELNDKISFKRAS